VNETSDPPRRPIFVIQRHDARRLHYDFRLERAGALASWAVPRGLPPVPGERRLAVQVPDHALEYADFEGTIASGYGAGSVEIWDRGSYELVEEKPDGGLTVRLHGERLDGLWTLVPAALGGDARNWLVMRKRDETSRGAPAAPPTPMLATLAETVPRGEGWRFEVKWDGYRAISVCCDGRARLFSRRGNDLSERFAPVAQVLPEALGGRDCIVDGEVCALTADGRASFSAMQQGTGTLVVYLFDLIELDGRSLRSLPLEERRARLERLVDEGPVVRLSRWFEDGAGLLEAVKDQGLEGVIAKRLGSTYAGGRRTRDWLKIKSRMRQEFVICGYTRGQGSRSKSFGSLVLGVQRGGELSWAGNCGTGFSDEELGRLLALLEERRRDRSPFAVVPKMPRVRRGDVVWVRPELVCEVEFVEWTHGGQLRAPAYLGLRDDKPPEDVRAEHPQRERARVDGREVVLSDLDRPLWPEQRITKGDLADYYRAVAHVLLPHLRGRPLEIVLEPDGGRGQSTRNVRTPVEDEATLLGLIEEGAVELRTWQSRSDRPDRPDIALFDLEPGSDCDLERVVRVALLVRDALAALGLEGYPKTAGPCALHVAVPVSRRHTFEETRLLVDVVARTLSRSHPDLVAYDRRRARRGGVLIEAGRNREGCATAAPYSVLALPGAPVSTPLRWEELGPQLDPAALGIAAALERVRAGGDLFAPVLAGRQAIGAALRRLA
jgi:bifunctional non-homologous end joining protein LigD